jgi:hypothetical protein
MNITNKEYEALLASAPPDHNSEEFLLFLRAKNKVVMETPDFLVVENVKYHTEEAPWYTAFFKHDRWADSLNLQLLQHDFPEFRYMINSVFARSIKRFHIHLLRVDKEYKLPSL